MERWLQLHQTAFYYPEKRSLLKNISNYRFYTELFQTHVLVRNTKFNRPLHELPFHSICYTDKPRLLTPFAQCSSMALRWHFNQEPIKPCSNYTANMWCKYRNQKPFVVTIAARISIQNFKKNTKN